MSCSGVAPKSALAALWSSVNIEDNEVEDYADLFVDRSLATWDSTEERLSLHDLQMDYVVNRAREQLSELHARLVDGYAAHGPKDWASGPDDGYYFQNLPHHLEQADRSDELHALLLNFPWLQAKLAATDIASVLRDFDNPDFRDAPALRMVHEAIKRSALVLQHDRTQLAGQLLGRLMSHEEPDIRSLLDQAAQWREASWLRPLSASLAPPDDPLLFTLTGHEGTVRTLGVTPDGRWGITVGNSTPDRTVRLWDFSTGTELHTLPNQAEEGGYNPVSLTPDGQHALIAHCGDIHVWDVATGEIWTVLQGCGGRVTALAVADKGGRAISTTDDGSLVVWDLLNWQRTDTFQIQPQPDSTYSLQSDHAVAITPDGLYAATLTTGGVQLWDLEHRRSTASLACSVTEPGVGFIRPPLALSADGQCVYFGSPLRFWRVGTPDAYPVLDPDDRTGRTLAVAPDRQTALLIASDEETLEVWDIEQAKRRQVLPGQGRGPSALTVTQDGLTAAVAYFDHYVRVWALEFTAESATKPASNQFVDITPDGQRAVASDDELGKVVSVWELDSGRPVTDQADLEEISQTMREKWETRAVQIERVLAVVSQSGEDAAQVSSAFAVWSDWGRTVVGDTNDAIALTYADYSFKTSEAEEPELPDQPSGLYDLTLWDLTFAEPRSKALVGHSSPIHAAAMTPDGRRAVSASLGRTVRVWDLGVGRELHTLRGHRGMVHDANITLDGNIAVSASEDCTVRVWDLRTWQCVAVYTGDLPMRHCAVHNDGRTVVACDVLGHIHLLRLECRLVTG